MRIIRYSETNLVKRHRGTMPIILTCPHGGTIAPANITLRTAANTPVTCTGGQAFNDGSDVATAEVTEAIAQKILELSGLSPYVVIAQFHRRIVDANRNSNCAYIAGGGGQTFYREYHDRVNSYIRELQSQNNNSGFLFDIHGTPEIATDPADFYLGTGNGATLLNSFNRNNLFLQHGLHGLLSAVRRQAEPLPDIPMYRVSPANATATETGQVNGGFTVRNYSGVISCIQIEIVRAIRDGSTLRAAAVEDLAWAMVNFVRRYAPF